MGSCDYRVLATSSTRVKGGSVLHLCQPALIKPNDPYIHKCAAGNAAPPASAWSGDPELAACYPGWMSIASKLIAYVPVNAFARSMFRRAMSDTRLPLSLLS